MNEPAKKRAYFAAGLAVCLAFLSACQNAGSINTATAIPTATPAVAPATENNTWAQNVETMPVDAQTVRSQTEEAAVFVNSDAYFASLGLVMPAPLGANTARFAILNGTTAQIVFDVDGVEYILRGSRMLTDIAGVEEAFLEPAQEMNVEFDGKAIAVRIRSTLSGGVLADWTNDGATFTLWAAQNATQDSIGSLALDCAMSAGVQ